MSSDTDALEEFNAMWDAVQEMYPKAQFSVCFDKDTLGLELSKEPIIFLMVTHGCYCYTLEGLEVPNTYIQVKRREGADYITYGDAVQAMVDFGYKPCSHYFLEDFRLVNGITYRVQFGS